MTSLSPPIENRKSKIENAVQTPPLTALLGACLLALGCASLEDPALARFQGRVGQWDYRPPEGFEADVQKAREALPRGFRLALAPPFILIGDVPETRLAEIRDRVVLPVTAAYWAAFLKTRPPGSFRVYLFPDSEVYNRQVEGIIGHKPQSHLGLYSPKTRSLFANTAVGYGWLCHELWHVLVDCDFPQIPRWLDEGMASLFEEPEVIGGRIRGRHNWRLWTLKQYLGAGKYVPLTELVGISDERFYAASNRALHYCEARYLCFYLQEKGLLADFYQQFRDGFKDDPTGTKTMLRATGAGSLDELDAQWRAWLKDLPDKEPAGQ